MTAITDFWKQYLATLPGDHPHQRATYEAWRFGDSPAMADELGQLVMDGIKTATASLLKGYETDGEPIPSAGSVSIILNGAEEPICIIETTEIRVKPFNQVDEQFAYDEGEDDRTLKSWKEGHERYFRRQCEKRGWAFSDDIPVVLERFKVIFRPA